MPAVEQPAPKPHRGERFIVSLLWNWTGVAAALVTGLLISPYLIRKLGPEAYGIWALSFSLVEYCSFLDLGFRSATVKYVAHYWALEEPSGLNQIINTGLAYAALISAAIFASAFFISGYLHYFFKVPHDYLHSFRVLVMLIALSWCLGFVFNNFGACLEAIQRFDLYNKSNVTTTVLRASGTAVLLYYGYGLIAIGILVVFTQCLGYLLYYFLFRRVVPFYKTSWRDANVQTLRKMGSFGVYSFLLNVSTLFLVQSPPLLIGHFFETAFVGFFQYPMRLIQYTADAVGRIGVITNASAAEMQARGDSRLLSQLAIYANRYSLAIFMPLAIVLWVFGDRLFKLWVPSMAAHSAPLLPILLTGYMIAVVAEFSSGMLLQGLGRHQWFARGTLVEAIAVVVLLTLTLPRYGIIAAAWVTAACMVVNRGVFVPWLVSREMKFSLAHFMHSVYTRPVLAGIPAAALACTLRFTLLPGISWLQLFAASALVTPTYFLTAFFFCMPPDHRSRVHALVLQRLPFTRLRTA